MELGTLTLWPVIVVFDLEAGAVMPSVTLVRWLVAEGLGGFGAFSRLVSEQAVG